MTTPEILYQIDSKLSLLMLGRADRDDSNDTDGSTSVPLLLSSRSPVVSPPKPKPTGLTETAATPAKGVSALDKGNHQLRLTTANGNDVTYDGSDIPQLPAVSFAENLDKLFYAWYAESGDLLVLNGQQIAVRDWDKVYKGTGTWRTWKSTYGNYKVSRGNRLGDQ